MKGQTDYGKGSGRRPTKDAEQFANNWDVIFKQQKPKEQKPKDKEEKK
jgi:hypothetical protein